MKLVSLVLVVLVLGCGIAMMSSCGGKATTIEVTSEDNGKAYEAAVGTKFVVTLKANETTPVHWQLPEVTGDQVIGEVKTEYIPDAAPGGMVGVGGVRKYDFEVTTAGKAELTWKATHITNKDDVYETFKISIDATK